MIASSCPICKRRLRFREELLDRGTPCPGCHTELCLKPGICMTVQALKSTWIKPQRGGGNTAVAAPPQTRKTTSSQVTVLLPTTASPARGSRRLLRLVVIAFVLLALTGGGLAGGAWFYLQSLNEAAPLSPYGADPFNKSAKTNNEPPAELTKLGFVTLDGREVRLEEFLGKRNVVLIMMRGYNSQVCIYCTAHTSRLLLNYKEFVKRNAEVLVVYPGPKDKVPLLLKSINNIKDAENPPFPLLLDEDLRVVKLLGIEADLAKPATYIVDKQGQVRFAYVGATTSDRPALKVLFDQLDALERQ